MLKSEWLKPTVQLSLRVRVRVKVRVRADCRAVPERVLVEGRGKHLVAITDAN